MTISLLKRPDKPGVSPDASMEERRALRRKFVYGHIPVKRSINFAMVGEKPIDWRIAAPAIALIIVLAGFASKVAVIDRFAELDAARNEVYAIQEEIRQKQAEYDSFRDISEDYAHYTTADMTEEECDRISRVTVMETVQQIILPVAPLDAWTLHENTLSIHVSSNTLTEITAMVQALQESPAVSACTIISESTTVSSNENVAAEETIAAEVDIVFKSSTEILNEAKAAKVAEEEAAKAQKEATQARKGADAS